VCGEKTMQNCRNKKIVSLMFLFLISFALSLNFGVSAPTSVTQPATNDNTALTPQDIIIIDNIQTEGKNNRKFTSDELTRQREQMLNAIDDRVAYYEKEFDNMITTAVIKLGLLWGGIVFFIVGMNTFLLRKLEKRRFKMLLDAIMKHNDAKYRTQNTELMDKMAKDEQKVKSIFSKQLKDVKDVAEQYKTGDMPQKTETNYYNV